MGDPDHEKVVKRAIVGCLVTVALLMVGAAVSALLNRISIVTVILAVLLILGGLGLAMMEWAERGSGSR